MLPCGHTLGFHCLARWLLSSSSAAANHCPLCRTRIVDPGALARSDRLSRALSSSLARLDVILVLVPNGLSRAQKEQLLRLLEGSLAAETSVGARIDRVMVAWEVLLDRYLCADPAAPAAALVETHPALPVGGRGTVDVRRPVRQDRVSSVPFNADPQAALFVSVAGMVYVPARHLCDRYVFSRCDSLTSSLESVLLWLLCRWVPGERVPLEWKVVSPGVLLGVMVAALVCWVDVRFFGWWNRGKTVVEYTLHF